MSRRLVLALVFLDFCFGFRGCCNIFHNISNSRWKYARYEGGDQKWVIRGDLQQSAAWC